jgi:hypothetical protein
LCDALSHGWRFNVDMNDEVGFVGRMEALHEATRTIVELDSRRLHGEDRSSRIGPVTNGWQLWASW